jgi:stress-induced morphogen
MQRKLTEGLSPVVLNIVNESHKHAGHAGNPGGGPDAETHFRCVLCPVSC